MVAKNSTVVFVSDLHGSVSAVRDITAELKEQPPEYIILGGDTPSFQKKNLIWILRQFLKLGSIVIIYPGSHENSETYKKALQTFSKHPRLIDGMKQSNWHTVINGWDTYIIPGSDVVSSGSKPYNGGNMHLVDKPDTPQLKAKMTRKLKRLQFANKAEPFFFDDCEAVIRSKKTTTRNKSIVFSHIPSRCTSTKGIDCARFGKPTEEFTISQKDRNNDPELDSKFSKAQKIFTKSSVYPLAEAKVLKKKGYPIELMNKNVGSKRLTTILNKYSITKLVCGHIHESGPRAIDREERTSRQHRWNEEAFINNGPGFERRYTILTLRDDGRLRHECRVAEKKTEE